MFRNFFFTFFLTLEINKCLLSDHGTLYIHIMLQYLIMYILLFTKRILVLFSVQNELRKKKGPNAVHRQLWIWYSFTFQIIALQYEGKALIFCVCVCTKYTPCRKDSEFFLWTFIFSCELLKATALPPIFEWHPI